MLQIIVFDTIILIVSNVLVHITSKFVTDDDAFFGVAKKLSYGLFVLLYAIVVFLHIVEFIKEQHQTSKPER